MGSEHTQLMENTGPVEVWLSQRHRGMTCMLVREDESTERLDVESLSFSGAQREITGLLIARGFTPDGAWVGVAEDSQSTTREAWRRFGLSEQNPGRSRDTR